MTTKIFRIEMEVTGIDSAERMQALTEAVRESGRTLMAAATLICGDGPPPHIALSGEDLNEGIEEIEV